MLCYVNKHEISSLFYDISTEMLILAIFLDLLNYVIFSRSCPVFRHGLSRRACPACCCGKVASSPRIHAGSKEELLVVPATEIESQIGIDM
jgi:hypothetical protein